jgi:hypothetical protein
MRTAATLAEDLAVSTVAGYLGTKATETVSMALYHRESDQHRAQEDEARPGPPFQVAAEKTARLIGVKLNNQRLQQASLGLHYRLGISWAPLYALLRRQTQLHPCQRGWPWARPSRFAANPVRLPAAC